MLFVGCSPKESESKSPSKRKLTIATRIKDLNCTALDHKQLDDFLYGLREIIDENEVES